MQLRLSLRLTTILSLMLFLFLAAPEISPAAIDCFTCHDRETFQRKVKHPPAAEGECTTCHNPHVARYKGLLQKQVKDLCYSCHTDAAISQVQGVVHKPVEEGQCLGCHNPHASDEAALLNKRSSETCFTCHAEMPKQFKHTHSPYAKGQCSSCHYPHQSANNYLLVKAPEKLCLTCHSSQSVQQKHPNYPAEVKNCGSCHNPHGSDRVALIRNVLHEPYAAGCNDCHTGKGVPVGIKTCLECHEEVEKQMSSSHNHLIKYGRNGCIACHSPHTGNDKSLLKGKEVYICGTCHEDTFKRNIAARFKHQKTESCMDCHTPHGSNEPVMARAPINTVCARCHKRHSEFTHPIGETVYDPRTGQMMTCISCHSTKGTEYTTHLRFEGSRPLCVQCHRDI